MVSGPRVPGSQGPRVTGGGQRVDSLFIALNVYSRHEGIKDTLLFCSRGHTLMLPSLLLVFLAIIGLPFTQGTDQCGPKECYKDPGCAVTKVDVEFVFLIDISGSMSTSLSGIRSGFTAWSQRLSEHMNPTFSVVVFGHRSPRVALTKTSNARKFQQALTNLRLVGGIEDGLTTIRCSLNHVSCPVQEQLNGCRWVNGKLVGKCQLYTPPIPDSSKRNPNRRRVLILLTDEDSDTAWNSASARIFPFMQRDITFCVTFPQDVQRVGHVSSVLQDYIREVEETANALSAEAFSVYMVIPGTTEPPARFPFDYWLCNTFMQYGMTSLSHEKSDFSEFDKNATLDGLLQTRVEVTSSSTHLALEDGSRSLQSLLLQRNVDVRVFDIDILSDPKRQDHFVRNFFERIFLDVSRCDDECYDYTCERVSPGSPLTCVPPRRRCDCKGVRDGPHLVDAQGTCCHPSKQDCQGLCYGPHRVDECGFCVDTRVSKRHSVCRKDCHGNYENSSMATFNADCPRDCKGFIIHKGKQPRYFTNDCGECLPDEERPLRLRCHFDCQGVKYYPAVDPSVHHIDDCGRCVKRGEETSRDECQLCIPPGEERHPHCQLNCFGAYVDGTSPSFNQGCPRDCKGHIIHHGRDPEHFENECGECRPRAEVETHFQCRRDCKNSKYYPSLGDSVHHVDDCNQCVKRGEETSRDECQLCIPTGRERHPSCQRDCFGNYSDSSSPEFNQGCPEDCNGDIIHEHQDPLHFVNQCGQCLPWSERDTRLNCLFDCKGQPYYPMVEDPEHRVDRCQRCVARDEETPLDECGVCLEEGQERSPQCRLDCFGHYSDSSLPTFNRDCPRDCQGNILWVDQPPGAFVNECGECLPQSEASTRRECVRDCKGHPHYPALGESVHTLDDCDRCVLRGNETQRDECHLCPPPGWVRHPRCLQNCHNEYQDSASPQFNSDCFYDCNDTLIPKDSPPLHELNPCGVCIPHSERTTLMTCTFDCNSTLYYPLIEPSPHVVDACGVCVERGTESPRDNCEQCLNDPTAEPCLLDCGGHYYRGLTETPPVPTNECGTCGPLPPGSLLQDSRGTSCGCNVGLVVCETTGEKVCQDSDELKGINSTLWCPLCPVGQTRDVCGRCLREDDPLRDLLDACGTCDCSSVEDCKDSRFLDTCDVCFGMGPRQDCGCDCEPDCLGVPGGTAQVDCEGICGGTEWSCVGCGNGIREEDEECDLGVNNGRLTGTVHEGCTPPLCECSETCRWVPWDRPAQNRGGIVGASLGSAAGIGLVAAGGWFAYRYALKKGLIGSAKSTILFGTAFANPLYEETTQVIHNPLYEGEQSSDNV